MADTFYRTRNGKLIRQEWVDLIFMSTLGVILLSVGLLLQYLTA